MARCRENFQPSLCSWKHFYRSAPPSVHSCELDISRTHWRNFQSPFGLMDELIWILYSKGQGHCVAHIATVNVIMMTLTFCTNVSSDKMMMWWRFIAKSQRSASLWHPDVLQNNVLALVQRYSLGKATWVQRTLATYKGTLPTGDWVVFLILKASSACTACSAL